MKKSHIQLFQDEDTQARFYKKVRGEYSKNHKTDSENLMALGGIIPFANNALNFSPGLYLERYLEKLQPNFEYLFARAQRPNKAFNIQTNPKTWYECTKVGVNKIGEALPTLSKALGLPHITNAQMHPTSIGLLKDIRAEDREIAGITGHKRLQTLTHYNKPKVARQIEMGLAISNAGIQNKPASVVVNNCCPSDVSLPSTSKFTFRKPVNPPSPTITSDELDITILDEFTQSGISPTKEVEPRHFPAIQAPKRKLLDVQADVHVDASNDSAEDDKENRKVLVLDQADSNLSGFEQFMRNEQQLQAHQQWIQQKTTEKRFELAQKYYFDAQK